MIPFALALVLAGAPDALSDGEVLGWTESGDEFVTVQTLPMRSMSPPVRVKLASVRNVMEATSEDFELEIGPIDPGAPLSPGKDAARWAEWKKAHPLSKASTMDGREVGLRVDGKPATRFSGSAKKVEFYTRRDGVQQLGKSMFLDYRGRKLGPTDVRWSIDPTGRRALFELKLPPEPDGENLLELVTVPFGPRVCLVVSDMNPDVRRPRSQRVEQAGRAVACTVERSPTKQTGVAVKSTAAMKSVAEPLARALGGTFTQLPRRPAEGDIIVDMSGVP